MATTRTSAGSQRELQDEAWAKPDPTVRTVELSEQSSGQLRRELIGLRELLETRLSAMDLAVQVLSKESDKLPEKIAISVNHLEKLNNEKFSGIQARFDEANKGTALALNAAKELVNLQNTNNNEIMRTAGQGFKERIDAQAALLTSMEKNLGDKIDATQKTFSTEIGNIKERLNGSEGQKKGIGETWALGIALVAVVVAIISSLIMVGSIVTRTHI